MHDGWIQVAVGKFATLSLHRVSVQPRKTYRAAGVLNAGGGVFDRGLIKGADTNYRELFELRSQQLVMRKLTAWEGPIAVVPCQYDGSVVSPEFPTFDLDINIIEPDYMSLICEQPWFWQLMRDRVKGSVQRRKRLNPGDLLQISVLLPPPACQRRIVDVVGAVQRAATSAAGSAEAARRTLVAVIGDALTRNGEHVRLQDLVEEGVGGDWGHEPGASDVDVPVYRQTEFTDYGVLRRPAGALRSVRSTSLRRRSLRPGDVLMQKSAGTPSLPGRVVAVPDDIEVAVPSNFVHLLRFDSERCMPTYVFWILWGMHKSGRALVHQAGTNIRNLNVREYLGTTIPCPPCDAQKELAETATSLQAMALDALTASERLARLRQALVADLMTGAHEIPTSYDELLTETSQS